MIKENIVKLELRPGSPISENELSQTLGLSRTPVREALMELSRVKIVEVIPQKTSIVAPIDFDTVGEFIFMRSILECAVVRECCRLSSPEDVEKLRESLRLQNFYLEKYYTDSLVELDNEFHRLLFSIAGKPQVYGLMQELAVHFDRVRNMALGNVKNTSIVRDHEAIVEAVSQRDEDAAARLMEMHLGRYGLDRETVAAKYPDIVTK